MIVWINGAFGAGKTTAARDLIDLIPNSTLFDPEVIGGGLADLLPAKRLAEVGDHQDLPIWRRLVVDTAAALLAELGGVLVVPMTLLSQEYRDEIFGGLAARRIPVHHIALTPAETILRARIADRSVPTGLSGGRARRSRAGALSTGRDGAVVGGVRLRQDGGRRVPRDGGAKGGIRLPEDEERIRTSLEEPGGGKGMRSEGETDIDLHFRRWTRDHIEPYRAALSAWLAADAYLLDTSALTPYETAVRIAEVVRSGAAPVCDIVQTPEPTAETLASGVLLFDEEDRVLLVDPTYKPGWEFPGGVVEPGEAPARAGIREVAEETGIRLDAVSRLLVIDWERPAPPAFGGLRLLFDGGRLTADAARDILLPGPELRDWRFVTEQEAAHLLPPVRYERLRWALRARERGELLYLEGGVPV